MKTFGELTKEEKRILFNAYCDGKTIQAFCIYSEQWRNLTKDSPAWYAGLTYRLAPPEPDSIDWNAVDPMWQYMARDKDGRTLLYTHEPVKKTVSWFSKQGTSWVIRWNGQNSNYNVFSSYKNNGLPWDESLVKRP